MNAPTSFYNSGRTTPVIPQSPKMSFIFHHPSTAREKTECIWLKTCSIFTTGRTRATAKKRLSVMLTDIALRDGEKWKVDVISSSPIKPSRRVKKPTPIQVTHESTQAAANRLLGEGVDPTKLIVLDLANSKRPGGGFILPHKGSQEEDLATDTDLYSALKQARKDSPEKKFIPQDGCLIIENVHLLRDINKPAKLRKNADTINVVAAAGLDFREAKTKKLYAEKKEGSRYILNDQGKHETKKMMLSILQGCHEHKQTHLVLGAIGCGAFLNEPEQIAALWKEAIDEFPHSFETIVFAIYVNPAKAADDKNLKAFQRLRNATPKTLRNATPKTLD